MSTRTRTMAALPFAIMAAIFLACASQPPASSDRPPSPPPTTTPPVITLAEFDQITPGMPYDQVVAIVGDPGTVSSEMAGGPGFSSKSYRWTGPGCCSVATVTFTNGTVSNKTQIDLK